MLRIHSRLDASRAVGKVHGRLALPFERRQRSRQRAALESGEEVAIALARGEVLRGGDLVLAESGEVIEVVAERERVLHVECPSPEALARVAYHLGNRHVPLQVGPGWLRLAHDPVLEKMVAGLGGNVTALEAPFEPEAGAYAPHHRHDNLSAQGGRIHEFKSRAAE